MNFPTSLDTIYNTHLGTDARTDHAKLHNDMATALMALQTKVGIDGSGVNSTLDYLIKQATNPGHTHTLYALTSHVHDMGQVTGLIDALTGKVDKVAGKQLSTEDYTTIEKLKLAGIEAGATLNSTDAHLLNRANHTGTQTVSTISNYNTTIGSAVQTALNLKADQLTTYTKTEVNTIASGKVDKVTGKSLINDTDITKLVGIEPGAQVNPTTTDGLTEGSTNKYDKIVAILAGAGISVTGTYPNFTVANTSPDQVVALTAGTNITITGTYPNFTINSSGGGGGGGQTLFDAIVAPTLGTHTTLGAAVTSGAKSICILNSDTDYNESGAISLTAGDYTIIGQSRDGARLVFPVGSDGLRLYSNNNLIKDLTVDTFTNGGEAPLVIGDGSTPGTPDTSKGNFNVIDGVRMRGPDTYGHFTLYFAGASYPTGGAVPYWDARDLQEGNIIKNCIIEGHQAGDVAVFALQKNGQFIDNLVIGGRIADYMNYNCIIERNIIKDSESEGIFIGGPNIGGSTSYNSIINPVGSGIKTENQLENPVTYPTYSISKTMKGNTVINAGYTGFNLKECDRCDIDVSVDISGNHGLYIQDSKYNNFDSINIKNPNEASNARGSGVYLYNASNNNFNNVIIEDNRVTPKMYLGFGDRENTACDNNNITNLIIKGQNQQRTVWLQSKGTKIANLYAEGGRYAGIFMDGATYSQFGNVYLKNNCQDANNSYGEIWFQNNADNNQITNLITESTATNKARDGIIFATGCDNNVVLEHKDIGSVNATYEDAGTGNKVGISAGGGGTWGSILGLLSDQTDLYTALGLKADTSALAGKAPTTAATISATAGADALNLATAYDRLALNINPSVARASYGVVKIKDDGTSSNNGFRASFIIQGANNAIAYQPNFYIYNYSATPAIGLLIDHNNVNYPALRINKAFSSNVAIKLGKGVLEFEDGTQMSTAAQLHDPETDSSIGTIINGSVDATPNDTDYIATAESLGALKKITWANTKTFLRTAFDIVYASIEQVLGRKVFHGIVQSTYISQLPTHTTTTTLTLTCSTNPLTYWREGVKTIVSTDINVTYSSGVGLKHIYFTDDAGTLTAYDAFQGLGGTKTYLTSVYWNGTNYGIVNVETHAHDRNIPWHEWAHNTIFCRYRSGLALTTAGTTTANSTFSIAAGEIADEDIKFPISTQTQVRLWQQTGASTYNFNTTLSTTPYLFNGTGPTAIRSDTYATVAISASNRYFNYWVFATTSNLAPIHIFAETVAPANVGGYTSVNNARAALPPSLAGLGLSAEWKLLYRIIVNGAGLVQTPIAADDYRTTSTVSGGGSVGSVTASSVTETNYGNVQTAIDTLIAADSALVSDTAYDATSWDGDTTHAPSKKAIRDKIESMSAGAGSKAIIYDYYESGQVANGNKIGKGMPSSGTITNLTISLESLPTGSNLTVDILKNGTSILSGTLSITTTEAATNSLYTVTTGDSGKATITTTTFSAKDKFVPVVVGGTTLPGSNLGIQILGTLA